MQAHHCEADVIAGLESFAQQEIAMLGAQDVRVVKPGAIQFYADPLHPLLQLKTVLSVYLLRRYDVPRPRALLGDQHLRALFAQIGVVLGLMPRGTYRTFMLGAAGSNSQVMGRLKTTLAQHTGLREVGAEGDLLLRIRPTPGAGHQYSQTWDVLVRISPRPLATRDWRVCNIEGSLQATVAHAMALLTRPEPGDVYLNLGCGSGTLLIERALVGPARRLIGCDVDRGALACAQENIAAYLKGEDGTFEVHEWDMRCLPLPDGSVDAVTADLPFGNRVGSHEQNITLYPALLQEAARVARPGAHCVLLTAEVRLMERVLERARSFWVRDRMFRVNLGGLQPAIFVLRRV